MTVSDTLLTITALTAIGALLIASRQSTDAVPDFGGVDSAYLPDTPDSMPDQLPGTLDSIAIQAATVGQDFAAAVGLGGSTDAATAERNTHAFLDMIAYSEGTAGPNSYRTLFGGGLVDSLADHPRRVFTFTNSRGENLKTTAAGRYQFLARTWDELQQKLQLPDFGPDSQDRAALELVRRRGALKDVEAGRIAAAIQKCAPIWASMPGAGYAQPERKLTTLLASYSAAGGNLEA